MCVCTLRLVSNQAEGTFARLRYSLGGDRPSQTAQLTLSTARIHGTGLDIKQVQGGISTMAQLNPEAQLHSLPPILRRTSRKSLPSCSKGSWGLSVLPRVKGIFTPSATSLRASPRQWGSRYAIRAGRNLPDKEFRYLRTVIVTAAVYWGFGSTLRLR